MDNNQSLRTDLHEAWVRYLNDAYTCEDLVTMLDAIKDIDNHQEFDDVFNREWEMTMKEPSPTSEEKKEEYRREAARLLTEYERKYRVQNDMQPQPQIRSALQTSTRFRWIYYAAAVLLLGLLIPVAYRLWKPKTDTEQVMVQYKETVTQRGEIQTFFLPDQTKVTLNTESRILYPDVFDGDERTVELHGEALFDVVSDAERPFIVKTKSMNIKVLGTVFDVNAYECDRMSAVTVISGHVEVDWQSGNILLEPNQQVNLDQTTGDFARISIDANDFLLWTNSTLFFYRTPIRDVVNRLIRHYPQVQIALAEGDYTNLITGKYTNENVETVLTSIVYSSDLVLSRTKTGNKYTISKK